MRVSVEHHLEDVQDKPQRILIQEVHLEREKEDTYQTYLSESCVYSWEGDIPILTVKEA